MSYPTKKITDLCDLERGTEPGSAFYIEASDKSIPFLRIGDLTGKVNAPKFVKNDNGNLRTINKNETLITFDGTPGIVVRGFKGAIASGIRVVRNIKPEVGEDFLFYYLQTQNVQKTIKAYSKGATIIHASTSIPYIKIPLPSLKIQKQIVERLDKIVEAQKLNNDLIQKSDELFQSLLHKELDPAGKNWEMKKLSEVGEIITGTTPSTKNSDYWNGEFLWATPTDIKENTFMLVDTPRKLSREGYKKTRPVPKNAILVTCIASIGKMALAGKEMATNQQINSIVCNKGSDPFFVFFSLQKGKKKLINLGKTTAVPIINKSEFGRIKIPLPPIQTQKQIVVKLSAAQDYKTQLLTQKLKLKELFNSVLSKSFRG